MGRYNFDMEEDDPIPTPVLPSPVAPPPAASVLAPRPPVATQPVPAKVSPWTTGFAFLAVLFFGLYISTFVSCDRDVPPKPDDGTVVVPDGDIYVGIFYQDREMGSLTAGQRQVLQSAELTELLDAKSKGWKKLDVEDDISALDPVYKDMADQHKSKLPWIIIKSGNKMASQPILSYDETIALLNKWLK